MKNVLCFYLGIFHLSIPPLINSILSAANQDECFALPGRMKEVLAQLHGREDDEEHSPNRMGAAA